MNSEYLERLRLTLADKAIKSMVKAELQVLAEGESAEETAKRLVEERLLIYWEMAWKWHHRNLFEPWGDWNNVYNRVVEYGSAKLNPTQDELTAVTTYPHLIVTDGVVKRHKLSSEQLAKYLANLKLNQLDSPGNNSWILRVQSRLGMTMEELLEARQLFDEKDLLLIDCLNSPNLPVIASAWPRAST